MTVFSFGIELRYIIALVWFLAWIIMLLPGPLPDRMVHMDERMGGFLVGSMATGGAIWFLLV